MTARSPSHALRVVVTGANGYLGGRFADAAEARGWSVVRCGRRPGSSGEWRRLPDLDPVSVRSLPLDCDAVVHFAALAHRYPPNAPSAAEYRRVNAFGTQHLAQAARGRARAVVFVSSVAAVGLPPDGIIGAATPARPTTPYGEAKLLGEALARQALEGSTTGLRVIRLPAVYGNGSPGAVGHLGRWVSRGLPVPSCCREARRSIVSLDNALDAVATIASDARFDGQTVLPTDGPAIDMLDLAGRIARVLGVRLRVAPCPMALMRAVAAAARSIGQDKGPIGKAVARLVEQSVIEDDSMERLAGWRPPVSIDESLARAFGRSR